MAIALLGLACSDSSPKAINVLVFSKTEGYRHESIETGIEAIKSMGLEKGFSVETTEDASMFNKTDLQKYNVVVFLCTTGDIFDEEQQLAFKRYIQAGGGFVGIHAATDTEYDWPWYNKLVGAYFSSHPNDPNVREAEIDRINKDHISTVMLPDRWKRTDEWYNFRNIVPHINVLLNLDETSYEGGTNGENHPIAWYHEFEGGKSWYTGGGHTKESYTEQLFLEHLWGGIQYAAGDQQSIDYTLTSVIPEETRFVKEVLIEDLAEPMELEILPNENILFIQRGGEVLVYDTKKDTTHLIHTFDVFSGLEDGLLGIALDPEFKNNKWLYVFYSHPTEDKQHISRFTMRDDFLGIDATTEKLLLEVPVQREECCHSAGSLEFGPDGNLFIATGDNTNPHKSNGYSPSDEREGRGPFDAQKSSANTQDLRGKVLRIKPEADGSYSIPEGNLFPKDGSGGRAEIYVMGCRNPYRISIDAKTADLYWGDVGPDASNDNDQRGPRGHDEVNQAKQAGFFGWPYFIGDNKPYHDYDFATEAPGAAYDPQNPINESPNNTGAKNLPPAQPAFIWYPYADSPEFPQVGKGGRTAMAGPVFHRDMYPDNEARYPAYYDGKLFIYEWMRDWIMAVTLDENRNFVSMEPFMPNEKFSHPEDMVFGPNGDLYMLEYGTLWFAASPDARLVHLKYIAGNRTPVAKIKASNVYGQAPLTVEFEGNGSYDFDEDILSYQWLFEGNEKSTTPNPSYTFEKSGIYRVKLTVNDGNGGLGESTIQVYVGNELPKVSWSVEGNRSFYKTGEEFNYSLVVEDAEDGTLGNGIHAQDVQVGIDYLETGADINEIAMGHEALQKQSAFSRGRALIAGSDCKACHQENIRSVGPSYTELAKKYKPNDKTLKNLTDKVINGGGGVWGETAMAAHPQLSKEDVGQMLQYILSFTEEQQQKVNVATSGKYIFDKHKGTQGSYVFSASYTDKGGDIVGPLTSGEVLVLKDPLLLATSYDEMTDGQKMELKAGAAPGIEQDMTLILAKDKTVIRYNHIDFTGVNKIILNAGLNHQYFQGGNVALHLEGQDGPQIGSVKLSTGPELPQQDAIEISIDYTTIAKGFHDLFLVFTSEGGQVCAVQSLEFILE